jgi:hypothetical protein
MTAKKKPKEVKRKSAVGPRLVDDPAFNSRLAYIALGVTDAFIRGLEAYGYEIRPIRKGKSP